MWYLLTEMNPSNCEQLPEKDCTAKCHSRRHAEYLLSCVTKGTSAEIRSYCNYLCHNFAAVTDEWGRNILHLAASCGKWEVIEWLLEHCHCDANIRDIESGWTALHRSFFYGRLASARILLNHGANLKMIDRDGLTPLDLIIEDRLPYVEYCANYPQEVYVWGSNVNYNLGLGHEQSRTYPEILEIFRKDNISIKQVVMCKFHTVFLSTDGRLHTCGHGHGGRLGHGSEDTGLSPSLVHGLSATQCQQASAGQDHLVLLMDGGLVFTCGLNTYHQLGHSPPPERLLTPRPISLKFLKGKEVVGVCAARFHSVFYTKDSVFTFGLNAGQLGFPKGERTQVFPRQVSGVYNKDWLIRHVVASDGATVCATNRGDVFVLHEFQHRKIASRQLGIRMLSVVGGHLDSTCDAAGIREGGGLELRVLLLTQAGKLYLWRQTNPFLRRCLFTSSIQPVIFDVHLNHFSVAIVTNNNQGYIGTILPFKEKKLSGSNVASPTPPKSLGTNVQLNAFLDRNDCYFIRAKRMPFVHRATCITSDTKARNFAVLQASPKMGLIEIPVVSASQMQNHLGQLLDETSVEDTFHDVVIKVGHKEYPAHKYILASRCEYLRKQLSSIVGNGRLTVGNVQPEAFEQVLKFIYSNTCDFLVEGYEVQWGKDQVNMNGHVVGVGGNNASKDELQKNAPKKKVKGKGKDCDPIKCVQETCRRFNLHSLAKMLESTAIVNGKIRITSANQTPKLQFSRQKMIEYYDVSLCSEDGIQFPCHRCILVARSEYFNSMLGSCWLEESRLESLSLPIPSKILNVLLNYLYTDSDSHIYSVEDPEYLCNLLAVADQLLLTHLKEMCEMALVNLLTLKNAPELLQLSTIYNAEQLKRACMEYICINLPAIVEAKNLDVVSDEVMEELSRTYRRMIPAMRRRVIRAAGSVPSKEELENIEKCFPVSRDHDMMKQRTDSLSIKTSEGRNKSRKRLSSQRSENKETIEESRKCSSQTSEDILLDIVTLDSDPTKSITKDSEDLEKSVDEPSCHSLNPTVNPTTGRKPGQWLMCCLQMKDMLSLDKIIKEQEMTILHKHENSTTAVKQRFSHMTQKQKKLMAASNHESALQMPISAKSPTNESLRSPPSCPWGKITETSVTSPSFWDAIAKGELQSPPSTSPEILSLGTTLQTSPVHSLSADKPVVISLEAIQRAEEEKQHKVVLPKVKPLHLINIEDQAIEELLALYNAVDNPRERVTVRRVLPERTASPVWKKHAMHSLQL